MRWPFSGRYLLAFALVFIAQGCALKPTKSDSGSERRYTTDSVKGLTDLDLSSQAVIVDARPSFIHSLGHIPGSVRIRWDDYTQDEPAQKGVLQSDLDSLTRRLSRSGIAPETPVTVLGRGVGGVGEEGRVAWMLAYLGVNKVEFADISSVRGKLKFAKSDAGFSPAEQVEKYKDERDRVVVEQVDAATSRVKSVEPWPARVDESLLATRDELLFVINNNGTVRPVQFAGRAKTYRIIDVRSEAEYLNKEGLGQARKIPNMGAVNIEWKQFLNQQGRVNLNLRKKLESVGVRPEHRIIVVSNDGVPSGTVTMALRTMGYNDSANYAGGLVDLLSHYK